MAFQVVRVFFRQFYRALSSITRGFIHNNDSLKASALTFYTLISIVPFLAVTFGIAAGFGFDRYLEQELKQTFEEQQEVLQYAIDFARALIRNSASNVITGIGFFALLWTNVSLLSTIESALNDIWKVKKSRTWAKKFTDYLAAMIISPIFFVVSSSLTVYLIAELTQTAKVSRFLALVSPFILLLLRTIPILLNILIFVVIYLFIPNTTIRVLPRIFAGIIAGLAFQIWQWIYIKFQVEISSYGAIYGTFAALPLFLIWVQVSWLIVLVGAEISAYIENEGHNKEMDPDRMFMATQKEIALMVMMRSANAYLNGNPPPTSMDIAKELGIALIVSQQILDILVESNLLVEVNISNTSKIGYQPSRDPGLFKINNVYDALDDYNALKVPINRSGTLTKIFSIIEKYEQAVKHSSKNLTLRDLEDKLGFKD